MQAILPRRLRSKEGRVSRERAPNQAALALKL